MSLVIVIVFVAIVIITIITMTPIPSSHGKNETHARPQRGLPPYLPRMFIPKSHTTPEGSPEMGGERLSLKLDHREDRVQKPLPALQNPCCGTEATKPGLTPAGSTDPRGNPCLPADSWAPAPR